MPVNHFRQRIPGGMDISIPVEEFDFGTLSELTESDIVKRFLSIKDDSYLAMSGRCLMVISDDGNHWWVIGYIFDPSSIDLPLWECPTQKGD
jgi:hypothetical protein